MHNGIRNAFRQFGFAMLLLSASAIAQQDKFAGCPDPDAAKQYVQSCLGKNPYNTKEICEQRAIESVCAPGAATGQDRAKK